MQVGKHESTHCQSSHVAGRHDRCALLIMRPGYAVLVLSGARQRVLLERHVNQSQLQKLGSHISCVQCKASPARLFLGAAAVSSAYSFARESPVLSSLYICE